MPFIYIHMPKAKVVTLTLALPAYNLYVYTGLFRFINYSNNQSHLEMLVIYYLFNYFYMLSHYNDIQINTKCPTPLNC